MTNDTAVVTYTTPWGTTSTGTIEGTHHQTGEILIRDHTTNQTVYVPRSRITSTRR